MNKKILFNYDWDVDKYKANYEAEYWDLCRLFMTTHKTKYTEQKLVHLTEAFYQIGIYGSSYDPKTTRMVTALGVRVVEEFVKHHPGALKHPFSQSVVIPQLTPANSSENNPDTSSQSGSIWDVAVDKTIIANVLQQEHLRTLLKGFVIIYDVRQSSTLNDNKISILEESFKRSKFGPCHWDKATTQNNICPVKLSLKWKGTVLGEAIGSDDKTLRIRLAQAVLSKLANFSSGIEAKWSYYRDGKMPDIFDHPNPRKNNIFRVIPRSQFKNLTEITSFIDTFANSDTFAENIFGLDYSKLEKKQMTDYITKTWGTKLTYRTVTKMGVKSKTEMHICMYHIRSGEELKRWLDRSGGDNDRYRLVPPGIHRRAGMCDNNVKDVLTADALGSIDLCDDIAVEVCAKDNSGGVTVNMQKQVETQKKNQNIQKDTNIKPTEKAVPEPMKRVYKPETVAKQSNGTVGSSVEDGKSDLEKLLDGFVLFYDANKNSEIDPDDWFSALCESFKVSKFGPLEVVNESIRPLRTKCTLNWKNKMLASAEGLSETQAKTAATLQLMSKLEPFTFIIQAKEEYFCGGKVPHFLENPDPSRKDAYRVVLREDLPSYYSIFQTIDEFTKEHSFAELVFGEDFSWDLKNEILVYLKAKNLDYRYFSKGGEQNPSHLAIFHMINPGDLKEHLWKLGGENDKYKLVPPPKIELPSVKLWQAPSPKVKPPDAKEAEKSQTTKDAAKSTNEVKKPVPTKEVGKPPDTKTTEKQPPPKPAQAQPPKPAQSQPPKPAQSQPPKPAQSQPPKPAQSQPPKPDQPPPTKPPQPSLPMPKPAQPATKPAAKISLAQLAEKRKAPEKEPEPELEISKIQINLKKFKKAEVEYPEDTGGDFPGLIIFMNVKKNSTLQKNLFVILIESFRMSKYGELLIEDCEEAVWGRKEPLKKCVIKSRGRKVLAVGLGESKGEAKTSASLQVMRKIRPHCYTIKAKESYFKEGKTTPYNFNPDPTKKDIYKVMKRTTFKDRPAMSKYVDDFSKKTSCPEEIIFGDDFSYDEREYILDHCRQIQMSYRLIKTQSTGKQMHTHIAIYNLRPLPMLKAELMQTGGENDKFQLISPGGKITNEMAQSDMWPDTLENGKEEKKKEEPVVLVPEKPKEQVVITNVAPQPVVNAQTHALSTGLKEKGDIDDFSPAIHLVDRNNPIANKVPITIAGLNAKRTSLQDQPLHGVMVGPQPLLVNYGAPMGPCYPQTAFQEIPFGPQPLHMPYQEMPLVFGPQPVYIPDPNVPLYSTQQMMPPEQVAVSEQHQRIVIEGDLRDELARKRQAENAQKNTPDRKVYDTATERKVIQKEDDTSWSRKVFVAEGDSVDASKDNSAGKPSPAGQGDLRQRLNQKDLNKESTKKEGSVERIIKKTSPERNMKRGPPQYNNSRIPPGRNPNRPMKEGFQKFTPVPSHDRDFQQKRFREKSPVRGRVWDRNRNPSYERTVIHEPSRGSREEPGRFRRSLSRSPGRTGSHYRRSPSPSRQFRPLWENIPPQIAETIFMYKYVKQDSTPEWDPFALLRATRSLDFNIDFDFIKQQLAIDEWRVSVELVTDRSPHYPLVGEGVSSSEYKARLIAAYHAVDTVQKACTTVEPNLTYFADGGIPEFISRRFPMKTHIYEIIQNLDPEMPLSRYTAEIMLHAFVASNLEDIFFLASDFSYVERMLIIELATINKLSWRLFGPRNPNAKPDDVVSTQHVCVYKEKTALQLVKELLTKGGSSEKFRLVDPRESRLLLANRPKEFMKGWRH